MLQVVKNNKRCNREGLTGEGNMLSNSRDITDTTTRNSWTHANNPQYSQEVSPQGLTEPKGVTAVIGRDLEYSVRWPMARKYLEPTREDEGTR